MFPRDSAVSVSGFCPVSTSPTGEIRRRRIRQTRPSRRRRHAANPAPFDGEGDYLIADGRYPCEYRATIDGPTPHELSERVARLEERMKTMKAEYKTDIALLAKTITEDNTKRDTEAVKRDKDDLRWQVGL